MKSPFPPCQSPRKFLLVLFMATGAVIPNSNTCAENEVGFIERFALATDRNAALGELVPGSPDYYYYHALHAQNSGDAARFAEVLSEWTKRIPGEPPERRTLLHRQALLDYSINPKASFAYLREKLGVQFPHARKVPGAQPSLPAQLDEKQISVESFEKDALSSHTAPLQSIAPYALESWVARHNALTEPQRLALLERLDFSESPAWPELLAWDIQRPNGRPFGSRPAHAKLLSAQLDALAKKIPALANEAPFVHARLRKLLPSAEVDLEFDTAAREAWLESIWKQASPLPTAFNSLKANILHRRLEHDRAQGIYHRERFLEYLKLPKRSSYTNPDVWKSPATLQAECQLQTSFPDALGDSRAIGSDEALVREYFLRILDAAAKSNPTGGEELVRPFHAYVHADWLRKILAEALITGGYGSPETWASLLPAHLFQSLKERTDVEFPPDNPPFFSRGRDIQFDVWIKNSPSLAVNIYEINALNVYLQQKREINTDLNLDGIVPNFQKTLPTTDNIFLRRRMTVSLPELKNRRGIWLVEVIGGSRSARALIRVGQWRSTHRISPAGVEFSLWDENNSPVKNAVAWLDGRRIESDPATGTLTLPFLAQGAARPVVFSDSAGEFAMLDHLTPQPEQFQLDAGFHLEREQLIPGTEPVLGIRAALLLGSLRLDPALLKDVTLRIRCDTRNGVASSLEVKDLHIPAAGVLEQKVRIPEGATVLAAELSAKMDTISQGPNGTVTLQAHHAWEVNGTDATALTQQAFLFKETVDEKEQWSFQLLGKNGEPLPDKAFTFSLHRLGFLNPRSQTLRTDASGRVRLGTLRDIVRVEANGAGLPKKTWDIPLPHVSWPVQIHAAAGSDIRIPTLPEGALVGDWSLLEKHGNELLRSVREKVTVENGYYVVRGLEPGDYVFENRFPRTEIVIRVTAAARVTDWFLGDARQSQAGNATGGIQLLGADIQAGTLTIQLAGTNAQTRVHIAARRFLDAANLLNSIGRFQRWGLDSGIPARYPNLYSTGRRIGDEYRYILERKNAPKFPGLSLPRPGLLLNPWETGETQTTALEQREGERAASSRGGRDAKGAAALLSGAAASGFVDASRTGADASPNLQFLSEPAWARWNLSADGAGQIRIPVVDLGDRQMIQVYADDGRNCVWREFSVGKARAELRDQRLLRPFNPAQRFTEVRETTPLKKDGKKTFSDAATTEVESFGSLREAFALLQTLRPDVGLQTWEWITRWASLTDVEKRTHYSESACHELNLFVWRKDPRFFQTIVRPYLANKTTRTFVDHFLLEEDLTGYLEPHRYAQLNALEKALLAWRLKGEQEATARHLREEVQHAPLDREKWRTLFDSALHNRSLTQEAEATKALLEKAPASSAQPAKPGLMAFGTGGMLTPAPAPAATAADAVDKGLLQNGAPRLRLDRMRALDEDGKAEVTQGANSNRAAEAMEIAKNQRKRASEPLETEKQKLAFKMQEEASERPIMLREEALAKRSATRSYYRLVGPTKEFAESHYTRVRSREETPALVPVSAFWQEFAEWVAKGAEAPFLSGRFPEASHTLNEALLVLAVLDLPFEGDKPVLEREGAAATLRVSSPAIVFHREIQPSDAPPNQTALQITQNFVRSDDRYTMQEGERVEKNVEGEFLTGVPYLSTVVVGNPTAAYLKGDVLWQIPAGALPLSGSESTHTQPITVAPYATANFEFSFYFPSASPTDSDGFVCHPASVTARNRGTLQAAARRFRVLEKPVKVDANSWEHISQNASEQEVFEYLRKNSLHGLDLQQLAWRCQDKAFFQKLSALLRARHIQNPTITSYGLKHEDPASVREWLMQQPAFLNACGPVLQSPLLHIDPIERKNYEHLEYSPLINPRAHRAGNEWRISNSAIRTQYLRLLGILAHRPRLEREDRMAISAFMLLQDRITEAQTWFATVEPGGASMALPYDYMKAVLDLLHGKWADARTVSAKHAQHPVDRWRTLFQGVLEQLDIAEGKQGAGAVGTKPDRERETDQLAASEPSFEVETGGTGIKISVRNIRRVQFKFYPTDPEFSFSANPFGREESGTFRLIKPAFAVEKEIPEDVSTVTVNVPDTLSARSLMVEVTGGGLRKAVNYSASRMRVDFVENYGRLEVRDGGDQKPLAKVYIKVYARLPGDRIRFFKDGYTDIRGRFDYASLNSANRSGPPVPREPIIPADTTEHAAIQPTDISRVEKFAVLVLAESGGAVIREINAPSRAE